MINTISSSYTDYLFIILLLGLCVLMLLAPFYTWKYRPHKALTTRILVALLLIPVSLYFLIDTFNTRDKQKNYHLLSNVTQSTDGVSLRGDSHLDVSDKDTFVSLLELRETDARQEGSRRAEFMEVKDKSEEARYRIGSISDSESNDGEK